MKKAIIMFMAVLPFMITSCKKELPVASFDCSFENHYKYVSGWQKVDYVTVRVSNHSYNSASSFLWQLTFPNGTILTSTKKSPSFVCDVTGNYELKLTAYNDDGENTAIQTFFIQIEYNEEDNDDDPNTPSTPPTASFNINSSNGIYAPSTINCNNTSVNACRINLPSLVM